MLSIKFLIDSMCANFTVESLCDLVKVRLAQGSCLISDIARDIVQKDRSLDIMSAKTLADAAVEALAQRGDATIRGPHIYPASGASALKT
ncbi:MAG: hypothetical protein HY664_06130 [Chloroflexi bacterium]|nr:hypothetical protein [Chloroflexota bacterium]